MTRPNMSTSGMRRWMQTKAFAEYRRYRDKQEYRGYTKTVAERALAVIQGSASARQEQKVEDYLSRSVAQYRQTGAGSRKFGGVAANVCALRNWGWDPHGTYR